MRTRRIPLPYLDAFMERVGALPPNRYKVLARIAEFGEGRERLNAIECLGHLRYRKAIDLLLRIIRKDQIEHPGWHTTVGRCCEALGHIDCPRSHELLRLLARTNEPNNIRWCATDAMGYEEVTSDPAYLIEVVRTERNKYLRHGAMWGIFEQIGLGRFHFYRECVVEALNDRSPDIRASAISCLARAGPDDLCDLVFPLINDRGRSTVVRNMVVGKEARQALGLYIRPSESKSC